MDGITINIGGYPRVTVDGRAVAFATRQDLGLLCYLALNEGPHSREKLVGLVWPGYDHDHGFTSLRGSLSRLRRRFDRQLDARRVTIELLPVAVERGHGVVFDGFTINPVYDAWVAGFRQSAGFSIEAWKQPVARSEISHITEYCRQAIPLMIYRKKLDSIIGNYHAISSAFFAAPDGPDVFTLGSALYNIARLTAVDVLTTCRTLATRETSANESVRVGTCFTQSILAWQFSLDIDCSELAKRTDDYAGSGNLLVNAMIAAAHTNAALQDEKILIAAEQSQLAAAYTLALGIPARIETSVVAARCAAMASEWAISRAYLSIAYSLINEYGSYHLLPSCAAIQARLDTYA